MDMTVSPTKRVNRSVPFVVWIRAKSETMWKTGTRISCRLIKLVVPEIEDKQAHKTSTQANNPWLSITHSYYSAPLPLPLPVLPFSFSVFTFNHYTVTAVQLHAWYSSSSSSSLNRMFTLWFVYISYFRAFQWKKWRKVKYFGYFYTLRKCSNFLMHCVSVGWFQKWEITQMQYTRLYRQLERCPINDNVVDC